ncbi:MAG TPA: hypothetical protein VN672_12260 [Solirubrobacteraceae bacterium]|nr:hypothetical protein [Solirubrobacteraceae bacterium]
MSSSQLSLVASVFLASAVEAVEALTIVLAVGTTRRWSSTLLGVAAATSILALLTVGLGPALVLLPIDTLRVLVGALLLVFGLQWLRKAILRASGLLARHDELAAFARESRSAREAALPTQSFDGYSFAIAMKGVLLEGLEVIFIVLTFGASQHRVPLAALAALAALLLVIAVGLLARAPLARVPENTMKFTVGVLLTTFGVFWGAEGAGASWPGDEAALPLLALAIGACSLAMVGELRRQRARVEPSSGATVEVS